MIVKKIYLCERCAEEFRTKYQCVRHEERCNKYNCFACVHSKKYATGTGCSLIQSGLCCNFKLKEEDR